MSEKDGGPAFPSPYELEENQGLSLRDYFAAKALQGFIAGRWVADENVGNYVDFSESAYRFADAMLAARVKS